MNIPLNIDWQQILLHLLNFSILAGGLYILLYKPVKNFMEQREKHYQDMDTQAAEKLQDADNLQKSYAEKLKTADAQILQKQEAAQKEIAASTSRQLAEAKKQADKILADAKTASEREKEKIMASAQQDLMDMAMTATEKLLLSQNDVYDQFLDIAEKEDGHDKQ